MSSEKVLTSDVLITSKTNLRGEIIYANEDFLNYSDYKIDEILYKPHSIMRHADMPRTVLNIYGIISSKKKKSLLL